MFGVEELIEKILTHLVNNYPALFGLGMYILALISLSTIALALVLIVCAVFIPFRLAMIIYKYARGDNETAN